MRATLLISCQDRKGLVAAMANLLHEIGANITHAHQHLDQPTSTFFQRIEFELNDSFIDEQKLEELLKSKSNDLNMNWRLEFASRKKRVAILVSKMDHCLYDLLYRHHSKELSAEIACIISNHKEAERIASIFSVPFYFEPVKPETKPEQEKRMLNLLRKSNVDLAILARYMQILSKSFLDQCQIPIINIHHSFLPAFIGKNPYERAYERGVKLVGATAHYVTAELDEGPIIDQDTIRVSHSDSPEDMVRKGRDIEKLVLARAVKLHLENRIFIHGNKTVIFNY